MARRSFAVTPLSTGGIVASGLVAAICFGSMVAVIGRSGGAAALDPQDLAALSFTVTQALLSALFSVALAIPLARALARRRFRGRQALILFMGAPFVMPTIVAVLGLIAVFGRNGALNSVLPELGLPAVQIYGLHGVVLAHVFFNLPLATRLVLLGWQAVPAEHVKLALVLRFSPGDTWRVIERPMLAQVLPGAFALIFLICLTSFAVALVLGGGPRATTIELAIYQAFRFDFDMGHAASLAMLQFALGLVAAGAAYGMRGRMVAEQGLDPDRSVEMPVTLLSTLLDGAILVFGSVLLISPLAAIVLAGLLGLADVPASILWAIGRSLFVAAVATTLVLLMALPMVALAVRGGRVGFFPEALGFLILSVSPLALGTGLFLLIYPLADPVALALPVTAFVNATLALPFVMQVLLPGFRQVELSYGALATHLGMSGWARWRWLRLPRLGRPISFSAALAAALSFGDLGVIALFADPEKPTLALYVYQLMGSYRTDAAAGGALILLLMSLGLFWLLDRGGRNAAT